MQQTECTPQKGVDVKEPPERNTGVKPNFIAATTVIGDKVKGSDGKELGKIEEIMLDLTSGSITYLVLSHGGVLGIGDKFFALPLQQLTFDKEEKVFYLGIDRQSLKKKSGFDKEAWPEKAEWPPQK